MRPLHWVLAALAALLLLTLAGVLVFTVYAMLTGRKSVSARMKALPKWQAVCVALWAGLLTGFVLGTLFAHWYFPTVGG